MNLLLLNLLLLLLMLLNLLLLLLLMLLLLLLHLLLNLLLLHLLLHLLLQDKYNNITGESLKSRHYVKCAVFQNLWLGDINLKSKPRLIEHITSITIIFFFFSGSHCKYSTIKSENNKENNYAMNINE